MLTQGDDVEVHALAGRPFAPYLAARFADDPHLWLTALFDEVAVSYTHLTLPTILRV